MPEPEGTKVYPWSGRTKSEVVVLLDDDPLGSTRTDGPAPWTCVYGRDDLIAIKGASLHTPAFLSAPSSTIDTEGT